MVNIYSYSDTKESDRYVAYKDEGVLENSVKVGDFNQFLNLNFGKEKKMIYVI